ncbi:hypothetical protein C2G38_2050207 [Gigaspora rosea]|uniref:Uncharacterized protein n=2 Tax=Gigaspora rosea TaxID=44941 RepID=A0A397U5C5_9GLOM|nr:hypothetical protein C2G38_2050207 [Gigaspora rosea]
MFRVWTVFYQYNLRHYNKLPLMFLSYFFYWSSTNHPISQTLTDSIHVFNDYFVENFHSSLRRQINKSNTAKQIIQEARIIDQTCSSNSFTNTFAESHNIRYSAKQLEYLEKLSALFLLNFFKGVSRNLGESKAIPHLNPKKYELPTLKTQTDIAILPMAWNTKHIPQNNKFCDLEDCTDSREVGCILICGHAYHFDCFFVLGSQCQYCLEYLTIGIEKNCKAFQTTLNSSDKKAKDKSDKSKDGLDIIQASNDTNNDNFSLDKNVDCSNIDALIENAKDAFANALF